MPNPDLARTAAELSLETPTHAGKMQAIRIRVTRPAHRCNDPRSRDRMTCTSIIRPSHRFGLEP